MSKKMHNCNLEVSRDTVLLGNEEFAAPEQYGFSASSHQTDIYAMGVLINVCLKGKLPAQEITEGKLQRIIRCCTELDPKDRYRNTKEVGRALKQAGQTKIEWLPPGFRTMRPWKMTVATIAHTPYILFLENTDQSITKGSSHDRMFKCFFIAEGGILFFYTDYLGIQRFFHF